MSEDSSLRIAIITVAGISSRFNDGISEDKKALKAIYSDCDKDQTLLSHLIGQCGYADRIIVVGGYKYSDLKSYIDNSVPYSLRNKIMIVQNEHYIDLASGYSLYLGFEMALKEKNIRDILFVEGDLDIDDVSFQSVVKSDRTVLTDTYETIEASKSVVFYKDSVGRYRYAFNSQHGLLHITEPFYEIMNSGQLWKFTDIDALRKANEEFFITDMGGTNLSIIQKYLDQVSPDSIEVVRLKEWTNCNTREDYIKIKNRWEESE